MSVRTRSATWGRGRRNTRRVAEICEKAAKHGLGYFVERSGLSRAVATGHEARELPPVEVLAKRLRLLLEDLGPTFIKIGQLLSVRPDLVPPDVVFELEKLQDAVAPLGFDVMRPEIEAALEKQIEDVFSEFDSEPLASASIGQVYRATLKENGRSVVVKVQRPGVERQIDADLDIVAGLARLAGTRVNFVDLGGVVREFSDSLHRELDYRVEARHVDRFRFNFRDDPIIKIPLVYWRHTSRRLLVMEYVEGTKLSDLATPEAAGIDTFALAKHGAEAFMKQVLDDGFFHGDLHPANLLVTPEGGIAYLDFGIVGTVSEADREVIARLLVGILRQDVEEIVSQLERLGVEIPSEKIGAMREELKDIVDRYYGRRLGELEIDVIGREFLSLVYRHRIRIPGNYALLAKALVTIEGVAKNLYPEINILEIAKPYVKGLLERKYGSEAVLEDVYDELRIYAQQLAEAPKQLHEILNQLRRGRLEIRYHHVGLEPLVKRIESSLSRLAISVVLGAAILGVSALAIVLPGIRTAATALTALAIVLVLALVVSFWRGGSGRGASGRGGS